MPIEIGKPNKYLNILYWLWSKPGLNDIYFFFFYVDFLARYDVVKETNFFLMKITIFQVSKQAIFLEFFKNLLNGFYITLVGVFGINQNIIKLNDDKKMQFFCWDFVDIALKASRGIEKTKKHNLVLKIAATYSKVFFSFVTLLNSHLIIYICQVLLSKTLDAI